MNSVSLLAEYLLLATSHHALHLEILKTAKCSFGSVKHSRRPPSPSFISGAIGISPGLDFIHHPIRHLLTETAYIIECLCTYTSRTYTFSLKVGDCLLIALLAPSYGMFLELRDWVSEVSASFRFLSVRILQVPVIFAAPFNQWVF